MSEREPEKEQPLAPVPQEERERRLAELDEEVAPEAEDA